MGSPEVSLLAPSLQEIKSSQEGRALLSALEKFMQSQRKDNIGHKASCLYLACALVYKNYGVLNSSSMPELSFALGATRHLVSSSLR